MFKEALGFLLILIGIFVVLGGGCFICLSPGSTASIFLDFLSLAAGLVSIFLGIKLMRSTPDS
ncbi:hypothetical protein N9H39_08815 [Gammaproteobacteria bacterium]|nr:hypothetical protein [Gammaproteobacteria bacterium]